LEWGVDEKRKKNGAEGNEDGNDEGERLFFSWV
jgi:hypothetical protein